MRPFHASRHLADVLQMCLERALTVSHDGVAEHTRPRERHIVSGPDWASRLRPRGAVGEFLHTAALGGPWVL